MNNNPLNQLSITPNREVRHIYYLGLDKYRPNKALAFVLYINKEHNLLYVFECVFINQ